MSGANNGVDGAAQARSKRDRGQERAKITMNRRYLRWLLEDEDAYHLEEVTDLKRELADRLEVVREQSEAFGDEEAYMNKLLEEVQPVLEKANQYVKAKTKAVDEGQAKDNGGVLEFSAGEIDNAHGVNDAQTVYSLEEVNLLATQYDVLSDHLQGLREDIRTLVDENGSRAAASMKTRAVTKRLGELKAVAELWKLGITVPERDGVDELYNEEERLAIHACGEVKDYLLLRQGDAQSEIPVASSRNTTSSEKVRNEMRQKLAAILGKAPEDVAQRREKDRQEAEKRAQIEEDARMCRQIEDEERKIVEARKKLQDQEARVAYLRKSRRGLVANLNDFQDTPCGGVGATKLPGTLPPWSSLEKTAAYVAGQNEEAEKKEPIGSEWIGEIGEEEVMPKTLGYKSSIEVRLKKFEGERLKWPGWLSKFRGLVHRTPRPTSEKLTILHSLMGKKPMKLVQHLDRNDGDYKKALALLDKYYGDGLDQRRLYKEELKKVPKPKEKDASSFELFASEVCGILAVLESDEGICAAELLMEISEKLPFKDRKNWRMYAAHALGGKPTLRQFIDWLTAVAAALRDIMVEEESLKKENSNLSKGLKKDKAGAQTFAANTSGPSCLACKKTGHKVYQCADFQGWSLHQRWEFVKKIRACYRCLNLGHQSNSSECSFNGKACETGGCTKIHHPLLHKSSDGSGNLVTVTPATGNAGALPTGNANFGFVDGVALTSEAGGQVAFGLLEVLVHGTAGRKLTAKVLIDNGSNRTFVSESFRKQVGCRLGVDHVYTVTGVGGHQDSLKTNLVTLVLEPLMQGLKKVEIKAWTMPQLTGALEHIDWSVEKNAFDHLKDLPLPKMSPREVPDILIGLDNISIHPARQTRIGGSSDPYAELTALGWVVRGPLGASKPGNKNVMITCHAEFSLGTLENRFFDGETFGTEHKSKMTLSAEDKKVWADIQAGICKLEDEPGYMVKLPWKVSMPEERNNLRQAEKRFGSMLSRLEKSEKDMEDYTAAVDKYLVNGYARVVYDYLPGTPATGERAELGQNFLSHNGVRKKSAASKLRVVFDAAEEGSDSMSLNDHFYTGPKLQRELPTVFLRWREREVAFIADIEAMFSRIRLCPEDARRHRWLRRFKGSPNNSVLEMTRVVFGDGPSPCLAIATLRRTAEDYGGDQVLAAETIQNGMYVDDLLESTADVTTANERASQISGILEKGDFHLRGWQSNHPGFEKMETAKEIVKVLGVPWTVQTDTLGHALPEQMKGHLTKRGLLSLVASLFSPLGLGSPFIIKAKIRLGRLHLMGLTWDEDLEKKVVTATTETAQQAYQLEVDFWQKWISLIPAMCAVQFPRVLRPKESLIQSLELHMFGDASEEAFAAAVYLRNIYKDGRVTINLIMAKTRTGPRKVISVAKMELQAALLGARLMSYVQETLRFDVFRRILWTDSAVTRHWIQSSATFYKVFVSGRVGEIQELTKPEEWRHLPGTLNVADVATRSNITEEEELEIIPARWIKGPELLYLTDESTWRKDLEFEHVAEENPDQVQTKSKRFGAPGTPNEEGNVGARN